MCTVAKNSPKFLCRFHIDFFIQLAVFVKTIAMRRIFDMAKIMFEAIRVAKFRNINTSNKYVYEREGRSGASSYILIVTSCTVNAEANISDLSDDEFRASKTCHHCGNVVKKTQNRVHFCGNSLRGGSIMCPMIIVVAYCHRPPRTSTTTRAKGTKKRNGRNRLIMKWYFKLYSYPQGYGVLLLFGSSII